MPIQIYWKFYLKKNENFQIKKFWYFSYFCSKHRLWVLVRTASPLEPPRWGGSNEYPQSMFLAEIRKIIYTPVNPSFTIKSGVYRGQNYIGMFCWCSKEDIHEEPQFKNIAYQWHQEEKQTNRDRPYKSHKPKKTKASSKVATMLDNVTKSTKHHNKTMNRFYDMKVVSEQKSIATKVSRLSWDSNPVCPVKNPMF